MAGRRKRGLEGLKPRGLRGIAALALLLSGAAASAGEPAVPGRRTERSAPGPAGRSAAAGAERSRPAPRVAAGVRPSRLIGVRAPLPPRSARADLARAFGPSCLAVGQLGQPYCWTVVQIERWPLWVRDDWYDRYDWRLPSAARVVPATGSPATVSAAYVVRAFAGETMLPPATISRGRPDVPLEMQPASKVFVPHRSR